MRYIFFSTVIGLFSCFLVFSSPAKAYDLGLTPSHVFGLWSKINDVIVDIAGRSKGDAVARTLSQRTPAVFTGKKPSDVLEKVRSVQQKLNDLRYEKGLAPTPRIPDAYDKITPSVVFLNSGEMMDAMIEVLVEITDPSVPISPHYDFQTFSGKTPSDVYGLVDLADQRLAQLR